MMAMAGPLTLNILQPALPGLAKSLNAPRETVQLTLSLYVLGMAVAQIISGPLADRFGRRPVALGSLLIFVATSLGATLANSIELLIAARIGQAMGATACLGLSRTIISDLSDRAATARLIAYVTMVMVIAPMASPNLGSALDAAFGWRSIFIFCAVFGTALTLYVGLQLVETRPATLHTTSYTEVAHRSLALVRNHRFMKYALLGALASCCFFTILGASPHLVIEIMGYAPSDYSRWFMLMALGYALGNFTTGRFSPAVGLERMASIGNLVQMSGIIVILALALADVRHPAAIFAPGMLITYGNGLVLPNVMAAGIQTDRNAAGAASGLLGFVQLLLSALASYIVTLLPDTTAVWMAAIMLAYSIAAQILLPLRRSRPE